jgi:hypothetical protein
MNELTPETSATKEGPRERARAALLSLFPKGSVGAEIGVSDGGFSDQIAATVQPKELVLIDPWDLLAGQAPKNASKDAWYMQADTMAQKHKAVSARFKSEKSVTIKRGFSQDVLSDYDDDYFDWVYIDGSHRYDDVVAELSLCVHKVKIGGLITGDDLWHKENDRQEVLAAVHATLNKAGMARKLDGLDRLALPATIERPSRIGQQFLLPVTQELRS